jgi:hypothetical protein
VWVADAENPYLTEDARRVLAEEALLEDQLSSDSDMEWVADSDQPEDGAEDADPAFTTNPNVGPGNATEHHGFTGHMSRRRHPPPPHVPPLHNPPHNPNAPGAYDPCVGKFGPHPTVSCFPRPPSPPPNPFPPPYPPMMPLASVPPFSPQDLGGILSGSIAGERYAPLPLPSLPVTLVGVRERKEVSSAAYRTAPGCEPRTQWRTVPHTR